MMTVKDHKNKDDGVQGEDELDHVPQGIRISCDWTQYMGHPVDILILIIASSWSSRQITTISN